MEAQDILLSVTTLSFDIFGLEIWLPLTIGAKVVIAPEEVTKDGRKLAELMRQAGATVMQATPYTWRLLLESGWGGDVHLKILCGGEAWPEELAAQLLPKCASLWNMYGPTESTIWSAAFPVRKGKPILIGRPIANTQFYVVDSHLQPVPIGVPGELLIGGDGLACGYLNNPELTAEKFIFTPFTTDVESRLYRTGDRVRYFADGTLEFLGRLDEQVKIRGFRIELGEIESALRAHPAVNEAAVIVRENTGEKHLVAYVVPSRESRISTTDVRTYVRQRLPDYMVPDSCVFLPAFPLTPNGKLNRAALPNAPRLAVEMRSGSEAPRDVLEQQLTRAWEKVLHVHPVGRHDNFFELGGHSFAAVRLLTEIMKLTGRELPLATLFQASTVASLAENLRKDGWMPSWSSLVPIQAGGSRRPLFLVHGAEGNVLLYRQLACHLGPDQPVYGLQSQGLNGDGRHHATVQEMASHYIKELRALDPTGPYLLGGYCLGGAIALEMAQQLSALGEDVALLVLIDTYNLNKVSRKQLRHLAAAHLLQNFWFHGANLLSIRAGGRWNFIREKLDVAIGRLRTRLKDVYDTAVAGPKTQRQVWQVRQVNDRAAIEYEPQRYNGRMVVIRCKGHFWKLDDPTLGWGDVARNGLELHAVPIYRKGILVEPFVKVLADDLRRSIDSTRVNTSAEHEPSAVPASQMQQVS
jgi:thioesterase domain-containing protein/acyl carrier protein